MPFGGYIYPAFDLNHSYEDCDVFVSIAKLKEHATAGITLSMKNCFGMTPCTIYGTGSGVDEPSILPKGRAHPCAPGESRTVQECPTREGPAIATQRTRIGSPELWWTWWPRAPFIWRSSRA